MTQVSIAYWHPIYRRGLLVYKNFDDAKTSLQIMRACGWLVDEIKLKQPSRQPDFNLRSFSISRCEHRLETNTITKVTYHDNQRIRAKVRI